MSGDAQSDLLAGQAAGISNLIMVKTGRGIVQARLNPAALHKPCWIVDDLASALNSLPDLLGHVPE